MVNIITKPVKKATINDFESFFERYVLSKDFNALDLEAMKLIDNAELLDKDLGTIRTKFGVTDVLHLSTGCKIVLSYLFIYRTKKHMDKILNITECGANALEVLFNFVERLNDSDTIFLLRHSNQLLTCRDRDYLINGKTTTSLFEGVSLYG